MKRNLKTRSIIYFSEAAQLNAVKQKASQDMAELRKEKVSKSLFSLMGPQTHTHSFSTKETFS